MIHHHRGNRRDTTEAKAKRKAKLVHQMGDYWFYPSFGQYRKGKIHCSCPMCSSKTNSKLNKSKGPVDQQRSFSRLACTNERYGKKYWKHSDRQKIDKMKDQLTEFNESIFRKICFS